jgi:hypothetical protein
MFTFISTKNLVAIYNQVSDKPITKFTDRATAEKRVAALLDSKGLTVHATPEDMEANTYKVVTAAVPDAPEPEPEVVPAEPEPEPEVVPAEPVATTQSKRGKKSPVMDLVITYSAVQNPKSKNSKTHFRFNLYKIGMTGQEYMDACLARELGSRREILSDLNYDSKMGFIVLAPAVTE